eukprot:1615027-Rhodomonas_salina.2
MIQCMHKGCITSTCSMSCWGSCDQMHKELWKTDFIDSTFTPTTKLEFRPDGSYPDKYMNKLKEDTRQQQLSAAARPAVHPRLTPALKAATASTNAQTASDSSASLGSLSLPQTCSERAELFGAGSARQDLRPCRRKP